tara:strand:- start:62 stop:985 length:924 start_codon:yes stop_codon:yes gene_type:complete
MNFHLNAGVGWCGTTPFYYTLALDNKYCHAGHQKENTYLKLLAYRPTKFWDNPNKSLNHDVFIAACRRQMSPEHPWVQMVDNSIALDDDLYAPPYSLDRYVDYYRKLYEKTKSTYHAVADFSNWNICLSEDFLVKLRDKLSPYFDIRVTFQFRDPISRYFSEIGTVKGRKNHRNNFKKYLTTKKIKEHAYYVQNIQKFDRVFGKDRVMPIIMEDFWRDKKNTEKLSEFLQYPIHTIHENAYVPDRGSNAPHYEGLFDQWQSDSEDMSPDLYDWALQYLGFIYDDWENHYGAIPKYWKRFPQEVVEKP